MIFRRLKEEREALLKEYTKNVIARYDSVGFSYVLIFYKDDIKKEWDEFFIAFDEGFESCCRYCKEHDISIIMETANTDSPQEQLAIEYMSDMLKKYHIVVEPEALFFYFLTKTRGKVWKAKVIYLMYLRCPKLLKKGPWRYGIFGR